MSRPPQAALRAPASAGTAHPPLTWPLRLYRWGMMALTPAAPAVLRMRLRRGKEDRVRHPERLGAPGLARPAGPLVWLHGASVGEGVSLLPLAERLVERGQRVLVTTGTVNSARVLAARLPPGAIHQYLPLDAPAFVRSFLDHWRPNLALFAESEIWPVLLTETAARGVEIVLVNARMSPRSFRGWRRAPRSAQALFSRVSLALAQSRSDAERLAELGVARVETPGNLKFDAAPPPADSLALAALNGATSGRAVFVAASTHPGEEEAVLAAHAAVAPTRADLLTILIPRHPERGAAVAALAEARGLTAVRREAAGAGAVLPEPSASIYVADTIGELGLAYRAAPLVFVGGSLVPHGGQNPIEPGMLGCAVLHGPHVANFIDVYAALDASGGARPVADADELAAALRAALADPAGTRAAGERAREAVAALGGALGRTLLALEPFLARAMPRGRERG